VLVTGCPLLRSWWKHVMLLLRYTAPSFNKRLESSRTPVPLISTCFSSIAELDLTMTLVSSAGSAVVSYRCLHTLCSRRRVLQACHFGQVRILLT
jgi:hypothetical protein